MTPSLATAVPALRGLRAAVFGAATLLLAVAAHVAGGGALPGIVVTLAVGVPVGCAAVALARRTRQVPSLLAVLAAAQVALHGVFMTTASAAGCAPSGVASGHTSHHLVAAGCSMGAMPAHPSLPSALMAALHAIATVAVALLLAHGERIVIRLRAWLHSLVRITLPVAASLRGGAAVLAARAATPPRLLRTGDLSRRGPPRVGPSPLPVHA